MINNVKILHTEILSEEQYVLKKIKYEYHKPDGSRHKQNREVYEPGNAAAILLYNKENKTVILTKQFRLPVFITEHSSGILIEACAGKLDGDSPGAGIIRETEEETGYKINDVQKIFEAYMSPGSVAELVHFFIAAYDESMKVNEGGGAEGEEENIDVIELSIEKALEMIAAGEIKDGKTIMLLQYSRLNNIL